MPKKSVCAQDYTVVDNALVFSDNFNSPLKPYYNLMKQYNTLKFHSINSSFNNQIQLTPNMTHVYIGHHFNHQLCLTNNLICLTLGRFYNKPLVLTSCLKSLIVGSSFNSNLILNKYLTYLSMDSCFNKHQIILSKHMVRLIVGRLYNFPIILTKRLENCTFMGDYKYRSILILQKNIKCANFKSVLVDLHLNKNIISLTVRVCCKKPTCLNKNIKHFAIFYCHDKNSPMPNVTKNLKILSVTSVEKHMLHLDYPLECIYFDENTNPNIIDNLPNGCSSTNTKCNALDKFPNIPHNATVVHSQFNFYDHYYTTIFGTQ